MQQFAKLSLHGDHLLTHMKSYFSALEVHPHFWHEEMGHSNTIHLFGENSTFSFRRVVGSMICSRSR